jgi:hypothetical protein
MPPRPDLGAAMVVRTRSFTETNALIQGRVSLRMQNTWQMPTYAVVWRKVPGPTSSRPGTVPVTQAPMQYECYGPDMRTADLLARTLLAELFPDPPTAQGFKAANCAVFDIQEMGAYAQVQELDTDYPRCVGTLLVRYLERSA